MDRRERFDDLNTALIAALHGWQASMWTALPGLVKSFDPVANTCEVLPAIQGQQTLPSGATVDVDLPLLLDCPVQWQGGGGVTLTFPIKPGDECLVVFSSRCIDAWWQLGAQAGPKEFGRPQLELRMHDLSDGFVLVGCRSQPRVFDVNTGTAQLRTDDGAAYVEMDPASHQIRAVTSGNLVAQAATAHVTAATITLTGDVTIQGALIVTGDATINTGTHAIDLATHVHYNTGSSGPSGGTPV